MLEAELDALTDDPEWGEVITSGRSEILDGYEAVFNHRAFTGRSQTMYRYEGLGSIYWHMVSKLLFALQERLVELVADPGPQPLVAEMFEAYRRVRAGLGYRKAAGRQGAFPTDPHSHTPWGMGAQQPGMTGQVKEGVLIRWGELGVTVRDGRVRFRPALLDRSEFLSEPMAWDALGADGALDVGTLGFTFCGVPVVYRCGGKARSIVVTSSDGGHRHFEFELDRTTSQALFARDERIRRIDVIVPADELLEPQGFQPS